MQRALGIFVAGVVLGVVAGFAFTRTAHKENNPIASNSSVSSNTSRVPDSSGDKSRAETDKIVLGNIATVPFQELYSVLSARSAKEMAELAAQLNDLPPGRETKTKITTFFTAWAHLDARAALNAAISLKTADAKDAAIAAVVRGADAVDAKSIVEVVSQLPAGALPAWQKTKSLNSALSKWSEVEPAAAAKFFDQLPGQDREFYAARMAIAQNWAASDPAAALAWAAAQGNERDARISMSGVIAGWWETDPRGAEAYVAEHADKLGIEPVMNISSQLYRQDPERAKEWANSLPTVETRRMALSTIANRMFEADPKTAIEWAATLPDDVRNQVMIGPFSKWAQTDRAAAEQWINNLSGTMRDEVISRYSATMVVRDPAAGLTWATSVSDPKIRGATMERIVRIWMGRSPGDATTWIQNSTLPDPEKTRLLSLPTR